MAAAKSLRNIAADGGDRQPRVIASVREPVRLSHDVLPCRSQKPPHPAAELFEKVFGIKVVTAD